LPLCAAGELRIGEVGSIAKCDAVELREPLGGEPRGGERRQGVETNAGEFDRRAVGGTASVESAGARHVYLAKRCRPLNTEIRAAKGVFEPDLIQSDVPI